MAGRLGIREEHLVQALSAMVANGEDVSLGEFCRRMGISETIVKSRCRSWGRLRRMAGLGPGKKKGCEPRTSRERVERAFDQALAAEGPGLTLVRFCELAGLTRHDVHAHCGSWGALRRSRGLGRSVQRENVFTDDEIVAEMQRVTMLLERVPKTWELARLTKFSLSTFYRRVGRRAEQVLAVQRRLVEQVALMRAREKLAAADGGEDASGEGTASLPRVED